MHKQVIVYARIIVGFVKSDVILGVSYVLNGIALKNFLISISLILFDFI